MPTNSNIALCENFLPLKKQILNVLIHMYRVFTNLLIYSVKSNFFFLFHKTEWCTICYWKSLYLKLAKQFKRRILVFICFFCKPNICCIKKIGSHSVVLSKLLNINDNMHCLAPQSQMSFYLLVTMVRKLNNLWHI